MDEEGLLKIAYQIAGELHEVTRSEWMKWTQVSHNSSLDKAIAFSEKISEDITLRPAIKRSNQLIAKTMRAHIRDLSRLNSTDKNILFGYVSRILMVATLRGSRATSGRD